MLQSSRVARLNSCLSCIDTPLRLSPAYGRMGSVATNEPEIAAIGRSLKRVGSAVRPGAYMVDEYPFLRWVYHDHS